MPALPSDPNVFTLKHVSRIYGGRGRSVRALNDINLTVEAGERVGIVGESGSGKSTLARLLVALDTPSAGELQFHGRPLPTARAGLLDFRRQVQIVFQDPFGSLDPRLTVGVSIAEPIRSLQLAGNERDRVLEILSAVGLPLNSERLYPHQLSGGQRQRVAIARALAPQPSVLIADEPVSALDVSVRAQVLNLIAKLVEELGLTLVFISHDMAVIRHICSRVIVLYRGELVEDNSTENIFTDPQHPYTRELLRSIPRLPK
ncbi:oligopeptide transport ATP-binding protein OppF [Ferrimicrobium acidiphilum DSM 19497]|uniref:Oligopeptide transport ATP-binding protein OppF n=1 Tax=Ferrimicrobium acidiphilum DSM 19497 TaxID=1121877 RepID=A0A0D8FR66_9ACTN|nr:ATP-binding cassette domain-containing protein [Ferrimicrobium acidiphilum]KJE75646.1 oligopeptide transport ATP-binding protein OppF [Ferrimicrobium acidiphilum DSM 19497]